MKQAIPHPGPNSAQKWTLVWKFRKKYWNKNQHPPDTLYAKFQRKYTILTLSAHIYPKIDLGFEIQKINVRIRISILDIPWVPFVRQNRQL